MYARASRFSAGAPTKNGPARHEVEVRPHLSTCNREVQGAPVVFVVGATKLCFGISTLGLANAAGGSGRKELSAELAVTISPPQCPEAPLPRTGAPLKTAWQLTWGASAATTRTGRSALLSGSAPWQWICWQRGRQRGPATLWPCS